MKELSLIALKMWRLAFKKLKLFSWISSQLQQKHPIIAFRIFAPSLDAFLEKTGIKENYAIFNDKVH